MARAPEPLAWYVVATTRRDTPVFADADACALLVTGLQFYRQALGFRCFAFAVLPAEFQLLVRPADGAPGLPAILKNVKGLFAGKWNRLRGRHGALWRRGFYDEVVQTPRGFDRRVDDIHAAPVRAGLAASPDAYRWSSARWRDGQVPNLLVDVR